LTKLMCKPKQRFTSTDQPPTRDGVHARLEPVAQTTVCATMAGLLSFKELRVAKGSRLTTGFAIVTGNGNATMSQQSGSKRPRKLNSPIQIPNIREKSLGCRLGNTRCRDLILLIVSVCLFVVALWARLSKESVAAAKSPEGGRGAVGQPLTSSDSLLADGEHSPVGQVDPDNLVLFSPENVGMGMFLSTESPGVPPPPLLRGTGATDWPIVNVDAAEEIGLSSGDIAYMQSITVEFWQNAARLVTENVTTDPLRSSAQTWFKLASPREEFVSLLVDLETRITERFDRELGRRVLTSYNWSDYLDAPGYVEIFFTMANVSEDRRMIEWYGVDSNTGRHVFSGLVPPLAFHRRFGVDVRKIEQAQ
ncbi:MAG: hypothetical protein KDN22_29105, partial [Verrucomicrobiae bacterium]|nr:hypothetical protein [Verrucomicrobiae bacterium]